MDATIDYRKQEERCLRLARDTLDQSVVSALTELAAEYHRMADGDDVRTPESSFYQFR